MRANLSWVGYVLGGAMLLLGAAILSGYLEFRFSEGEHVGTLRTVFGVVLLLYGVYRIALTDMQRRRHRREQAGL